ncbi:putative zinc finger protein [Paratrimastix pyriformis]|uniref:Zinc finger protein n=1 Tax=Paratrimastix pyriformis TaxID=342808 RepID=A0ABQ8UX38_9EUKA|nr:putative zinc finger protein [Paratrimastix pyriformis]
MAQVSQTIISESAVEDVVAEVTKSTPSPPARLPPRSSGGSSSSRPEVHLQQDSLRVRPSPPSETNDALLSRVTEKLAIRMREELKAELDAAERSRKAQDERVDAMLAQELQSNTCPICYELMAPPDKNPVLLFPCGHTFCALCLASHIKAHSPPRCPYCRQDIVSQAPNHALKNLIADFLRKKAQLGLRPDDPLPPQPPPQAPQGGARSSGGLLAAPPSSSGLTANEATQELAARLRTLEMRCRVMANELEARHREFAVLQAQRQQQAVRVQQSRRNLDDAQLQLRAAQERVKAAEARLAPDSEELGRLEGEENAQREGLELMGAALHRLTDEYDRLDLILRHATPAQGATDASAG